MKQTNLYIDFQGKLQDWVYDVVTALNSAPEFDSNWLSEEWVEDPFKEFSIEKPPTILNPPSL